MANFRKGNLKLAAASLKNAKARSFLTMLGIVIGVMSVICVVCIGEGVKQQIDKQIGHFGKDLITIRPGASNGSLGNDLITGSGLPVATSSVLADRDLQVVAHTAGVKYAVPLSVISGSATGDHSLNAPLVVGTSDDFPTVVNQPLAYGGFFSSEDTTPEVVLGKTIAAQLFDDSVPLGRSLTFRGQQFVVEGVFKQFDSTPFSLSADFNDAIFIPYDTARTFSGGDLGIYQILAKPADPNGSSAAAQAIKTSLANAHGGAHDDSVLTQRESTAASNQIVHLLTLLIIGVAAIALIVGGVGIMDVMLVSVTERMHEIGIRKAIGATNRQIMRQFMAEALVLSGVGAFTAVLLSLATIGLMRLFTSLQPVPVWQVFVLAPLVSVAIGVIFGTAPALKAAHKDPIEALRHE